MTAEEGGRKKPCVANMQLMCFSKTWDCAAYVNLVGKDMAMPGEDATMDMKLLKPMVLEEGQQFTVRDSAGTIGTGQLSLHVLYCSKVKVVKCSGFNQFGSTAF
jgi:elongation factor Tu